jgi:hypothetical protein
MSQTIGIHWIVTTHGTWLHGDPRGSWRNGRLIGPDPFLESMIRSRLTHGTVVLSEAETILAAQSFGETINEHHHRAFAATVQATHSHLVLAPTDADIKTVIARLKRRSASAVLTHRRSNAVVPIPRSLWTEGQFFTYIFEEAHLVNVIEYVRDHNRRAGLPPNPYEWIDPLYPAGDVTGERFFGYDQCEQPRT